MLITCEAPKTTAVSQTGPSTPPGKLRQLRSATAARVRIHASRPADRAADVDGNRLDRPPEYLQMAVDVRFSVYRLEKSTAGGGTIGPSWVGSGASGNGNTRLKIRFAFR
jgi:hypothetical protein